MVLTAFVRQQSNVRGGAGGATVVVTPDYMRHGVRTRALALVRDKVHHCIHRVAYSLNQVVGRVWIGACLV
jgi:hypothetical protein